MAERCSRTRSNQAETVGDISPLGRASTSSIGGEVGRTGRNATPGWRKLRTHPGTSATPILAATAISTVCIMGGSLTTCGVKPALAQSCVIASTKLGASPRLNIRKFSAANFSNRTCFDLASGWVGRRIEQRTLETHAIEKPALQNGRTNRFVLAVLAAWREHGVCQ